MIAALIQIDGYDPVAAAAVTLYASSVDDDRVCHLNGQTWLPALSTLPALRYDLFDGDFSGRISTPQASLALGTEDWPNFARYLLADARVRLWTGEPGDAWASWTLRFDGRAQSQPTIRDGVAALTIAVDDRWLDKPLLSTYAGTTGIEGEAAMKGQVKPLALGAPRYVPGVLIDSVNNVIQLSAYGLIEGVEQAMEKLARFGASLGDHASYAALIAASVPAGQWATCKASGLVRHGAPPAGRLSYQVQGDKAGPDGWARLPGKVIRRIALLAGGSGKIDDASLNNLDTARPWTVSIYQDRQATARELIQRIAASVNAVAGVDWLGKLFVVPVGFGTSSLTLDATGAALPPVASVEQLDIAAPFWKLAIGAEPTWSVHALSDVAFTALLVERGRYSASETYREGHIVDLADGSVWLYINATPTSGNAPPAWPTTSNAWWSNLSPPTNLGNLTGNLDNIADGSTYAKPLATQLTSGQVKLAVAGSGAKLGDSRNAPNIVSNNLSYKFTGTISYTSAAGSPATATISVTAGDVKSGVTVSYNAMSANVTGTGGTSVQYYLYVDDPTNAGGAQTLIATTTALDIYSSSGRVYIGEVLVAFPTSGSGGGSGGGGGGTCVWEEAWVETQRGAICAADIVPGDMLRVLADDRLGLAWQECESNEPAIEFSYRITSRALAFEVTVSQSTPISLRDGSVIAVADIDGHELPLSADDALWWEECCVEPLGPRPVRKIRCGQKTYAAGDVAGRNILTHNPKP